VTLQDGVTSKIYPPVLEISYSERTANGILASSTLGNPSVHTSRAAPVTISS
jgi:hypothetical protein